MATLAELEITVVSLQATVSGLPTAADQVALTSLLDTRHSVILTSLTSIESRLSGLEDAILALREELT